MPSVAPTASPKPAGIDFTAERARLARFVGRASLLAQLDQLLIGEPADRSVVVTGGPGMGKSALFARRLARREAAGTADDSLVGARVRLRAQLHRGVRRGEEAW